jgi:YHS domain-containing protein
MVRAYITSTVAGAFLLGLASAAVAVTGEFNNMCTMGLATGKDIQTDCSINSQVLDKTYCFGSKEAMAEFMKNPTANLQKAQAYYQSKHPG